MNYYNEHDNFAADWLENLIKTGLIPDGKVDRRSIVEVQADDVRGFTQCHFFAGIGGWSLALRLACWGPDRPVWTGSCPCQPFSRAGKQKGQEDERHLWPEMFRLIRECQPVTVFGEQVASAIGHGWLDGISDDLEGENYAVGSIVLGAFSVGSPHKRSRLYWLADAAGVRGAQHVDDSGKRETGREDHSADCCRAVGVADFGCVRNERARDGGIETRKGVWRDQPATGRDDDAVGQSDSNGRRQRLATSQGDGHWYSAESASCVDAMGGTINARPQRHSGNVDIGNQSGWIEQNETRSTAASSPWSQYHVVDCLDGKSRRVGCGVRALVNGISRSLGRGKPELWRLAKRARANRVGRLKGYGNAIVPQVAAEFVMAFMECRSTNRSESCTD